MNADMIRISSAEASVLEFVSGVYRRVRTRGRLQKGKGSG
jgi:hypothetical protein